MTHNYQIYVITITGRQKSLAQLLANVQAPFSCEETTPTRSLRGPPLLLELLASFWSCYTTVFLSTVSGPSLDQDLKARTLISAGSLALGFANPFSPQASSFCWCFFFLFLSTSFSQSMNLTQEAARCFGISHADVLGWSEWWTFALCELRGLHWD